MPAMTKVRTHNKPAPVMVTVKTEKGETQPRKVKVMIEKEETQPREVTVKIIKEP